MRKKKWIMHWQAALLPDPLMVPDATVFLQTLPHDISTAKVIAPELSGRQPASSRMPSDTGQKGKKSNQTEEQMLLLVENTFSPVENMVVEFDPAVMSFLQAEENDLAAQRLSPDSE
jgi:hypothetical protein